MKAKHKKRALQLDFIRQKENEASDKSNNKNKQSHNSGGSSDFSQFELQSKDINNEFTPFLKPKQWKKQSQRNQQLHKKTKKAKQHEQHKEIKQLKQIHRNRKKQQKLKNQENQQYQQTKNKQKNKNDKTVSHIISFAKSPSNSKQSPQIDKFQLNRINKQSVNNPNDDQSLITEYDKRQFNDKSPKKQAEQHTKDLERSRKIQQQKQLKQNGMIEATGGLCFQINKSDFVYQQQVKPKKKKKKTRKIQHRQQNIGSSINTNIQLMKRRERAFRYGQFIRRRTFGYY